MADPVFSAAASELPLALYTAAQSRQLDLLAQRLPGISGDLLMRRAGSAAFDALRNQWPEARRLLLFCGGGNNGGDGYVVAELAQRAGFAVTLVALVVPARLQGEALVACRNAAAVGIEPVSFAVGDLLSDQHDLIIDALLGTGISGEVRSEYRAAIDWINASGLPVVAVDIPSGLDADTGRMLGSTVQADLTITFIAVKRGLLTGVGPDHTGILKFTDLELPVSLYQQLNSDPVVRLSPASLPQLLPRRRRTAHKGEFGHLLIVGGNHGYGGAVSIAAEAALRAGVGLVTVATRGVHLAALLARRPEIMVRAVESGQDLEPLLALPTVILLGPGLGQDAWAEQMLQRVLGSDLPLVIDADGLNLLAHRAVRPQRQGWILTPHPGEAARLLDCSSGEVEADRFAAVQLLAERFGGVALLKGAGTLIASSIDSGQTGLALCAEGNPGMASGGMGDLLSGIIAALLAQRLSPVDAARAGVLLHAMAGDEAAGANERGLVATDLLEPLRRLVNPVV